MPTWLKLFLFFPVSFLKIIRLLWRARRYRKDHDRYTVQQKSDFILKECLYILFLFNVKVKTFNYETLPKAPFLLAANHVDYLDIIVLIAAMKKQTAQKDIDHHTITFLAKKELKKNFLAKAAATLLDVIFIDRENIRDAAKGLIAFADVVRLNKTIGVIFPEGTRSKTGKLGDFKSGIFKIAQKQLLDIVPTTINNTKIGLSVKRRKYEEVEVDFHKAIKGRSTLNLQMDALSNKVRNAIQESLKDIGDVSETTNS